MKAVMIVPGETGGRTEIQEVPRPALQADEVLVKVKAAGLNRGELIMIATARSGPAQINGVEFAGEVVETGADVVGFDVGQRVMGQGRACMAQYVAISPRALMPVPSGWSWAEAAAFPNVFVTAHDAIVSHGRLAKGESVLINAASSGIGTAAIQIAWALGARKIIGASRSSLKLEQVRSLGLTDEIATDVSELTESVLAATDGAGVDLIIDSLGAAMFDDNLRAMAVGGRLISVGRLTGKLAEIDLDWLSLRRLEVIGVTFRTRTVEERLNCVQAAARDLSGPLERGEIRPVIDRVLPFDSSVEAHARLESNAQVGKIVLTLEGDEAA